MSRLGQRTKVERMDVRLTGKAMVELGFGKGAFYNGNDREFIAPVALGTFAGIVMYSEYDGVVEGAVPVGETAYLLAQGEVVVSTSAGVTFGQPVFLDVTTGKFTGVTGTGLYKLDGSFRETVTGAGEARIILNSNTTEVV